MARYKIILAYDGTHFAGSQRQKSTRTIQGELEKALREIGWMGRTIVLAGRTDSGVHGCGQVAAFDLDWRHDPDRLQKALNSNLPLDMAVSSVETASDHFHPRFDATWRRYRYRLFCASGRDPLRERYAWRVWPAVENLAELAGMWPGRHDFEAFGSPSRQGGSTVRTVHAASWEQKGDEWIFEIQADGFLYRMVRRIVYVQVAAGQGKLAVGALRQALRKSIDLPAGLAPAQGLMLIEVGYADLA